MNAKHEYEFIANFKILQNAFRAHKIDKVCSHVLRVNRGQTSSASCQSAYTRRKTRQMQDAVRQLSQGQRHASF